MSRLIDADALKKDLSENYVFYGFKQLLNDFYEALDSAPTIEPKQADDLISRADAIEAFADESNGIKIADAIGIVDVFLKEHECDELWDAVRAVRDCLECARDSIEEFIPSAQPKQGEWKIEEANSVWGKGYMLTCSECGESFRVTETALPHEHFCRNCGARMNYSDFPNNCERSE